ncbi:hypothetical protein J2Y69_002793 [Microbacterium resistens]|uniref:ABC-2 type transport system permease protein n=1 Tax=Microbacterium resistens TaxID=156977 RepID=A0ABU1SEZ4_9MICO|nr:hypothetical protein [Microbacterium resistens]MDR6868182.1 hypothetical protein [Microbacterium resistens]
MTPLAGALAVARARARARAAMRLWRHRDGKGGEGLVFLLYASVVFAVVAIIPVVRLGWILLTDAPGLDVLMRDGADAVAMLVTALVWAGAALLGRVRGPAVLPPVLTHALWASALPRRVAFAGPVSRAILMSALAPLALVALIATALWSSGRATGAEAVVFGVGGLGAGLVTGVMWLFGQAYGRLAPIVSGGILLLGALSVLFPTVAPIFPWAWVGLSYAPGGSPIAAAGAVVLGIVGLLLVPFLMDRLEGPVLDAQAARWDTARVFASTLDLGSASDVYRTRPHLLRRLRVVRPIRSKAVRFLVRDALGALRTPWRTAAGGAAVLLAGAGLAAVPSSEAGWALGVALVAYLGLGPLTDGIRHAAAVSADLPLYGLSDRRLLAYHSILPLLLAVVLLGVGGAVGATAFGFHRPVAVLSGMLTGVVLAVLLVMIRAFAALKGPMPPSLLVPVPTPMGDLGAVVRAAWSLDAPLLAALSGALVVTANVPMIVAGALAVAALLWRRWARRRRG